jgi:hypothetical protein
LWNDGLLNIAEVMALQKRSMPSFVSIISILSIVFYSAGFLRVELELHEQKKRINALENIAEAKSPSNDANMKIIKNDPGKFLIQARVYKLCYSQEIQLSESKLVPGEY